MNVPILIRDSAPAKTVSATSATLLVTFFLKQLAERCNLCNPEGSFAKGKLHGKEKEFIRIDKVEKMGF